MIFLSTLSLRRATVHAHHIVHKDKFLSTLSLRRATACDTGRFRHDCDFYPRSPCGERHAHRHEKHRIIRFLSTLSLRRATARRESRQQPAGISIHALLAESDNSAYGALDGASISIHALLAESDAYTMTTIICTALFLSTLSLRRATRLNYSDFSRLRFLSTLSLRRATPQGCFTLWEVLFLSTLSLRRATLNCSRNGFAIRYFYPRSPCGERPAKHTNLPNIISISIHALLAESDCMILMQKCFVSIFLSTLSLRRATINSRADNLKRHISIHALLAESDT